MLLKVIKSGSSGNGYILQSSTNEVLLIECGTPLKKVKEALNFDLSGVVGLIVSHFHGDHFRYAKQYLDAAIDIYSSKETFELAEISHHRLHTMKPKSAYKIGSFKVMGFMMPHDDIESMGFLITYESNTILFATDCHYIPYTFKGLNNILIEANNSIDIIDQRLLEGSGNAHIRDRVINSHLEFETTLDFLRANDLSRVSNIVLIHLSDGNSDAKLFKSEVEKLTGKSVHIADAGVELDFSINPF